MASLPESCRASCSPDKLFPVGSPVLGADGSLIRAVIIKTITVGRHTEYIMRLEAHATGRSWVINRRFRCESIHGGGGGGST
jgi:hypothetical protein